jgi:hypothetical protein
MDTLSRPYPCPETFMPVVYFVAEKYWQERPIGDNHARNGLYVGSTKLVPNITIHTSNTAAAAEMRAVLKDNGIDCDMKLMGLANRLEMEV